MKKFPCLIITLLTLSPTAFTQSCKEEMVMALQTSWTFEKNVYMKGQPGLTNSLVSNIFKNTDEYKKLFLAAYPKATGGTIRGTGYVPPSSEYDIKGLQAYQYHVSFLDIIAAGTNRK